jgi:hypothetical protein
LDLIGQENLDKIRNTHVLKNGVPTENKCDTLIQTLEDIGKLTEENIAEMETSPVTKEALILIRNELVNSAGEYDQQKARDFEKRIMNYPPNKEHYINGMLDYSKWLGEIKVGFKVINGELVIVQNSMELTTMPGDDQLKLVFSTIDHDINGNEKVTKYSVIYDITDKYHNEENPRLIIEPLPNPEIQRKDGETIIHYLLDNHLVSVGAMQTELGKVRVAQYLSIPQSEGAGVYLNRLELFARMGVHDILKFTNDINPQELVQFEDSGKQFTYGYDEEMQEDIMLNGKQLSGWTYTISIDSGPAFNVFLSKTEKDNDIPYVCLGTKSDLELMGLPVRTSKLLTSDTNDNIWIRASKTNQNEAYKVYDNKGFWRKFNF